MGRKDLAEKSLLQLPEVFADVINVLVGKGERFVSADQLREAETEVQYYDPDTSQDRVRIPDVSKWILVKDKKLRVNIQNETGVDAMILLRIAGHDGGHYSSLYQKKEKKIPGVLTLVLYYGIEFQSDFWFLADYLWQARRKKNDRNNNKYEIPKRKMKNSYYVLKLLCTLEGNNSLLESCEKKGDDEDMGGIISRWGEEAEARGEARGLARGEARGRIKTEDRNNRLFAYLLRDGRLEEAKISTENPAVKEKLYKEYNIE